MKYLAARHILLGCVVLLVLFGLLVNMLEPSRLIEYLNGVAFGGLLLAGLIWVPALWRASRRRQFTRVSQLIMGIGCFLGAAMLQRVLSVIYRALDKPVWMADSAPFAFVAYLTIIGSVLVVMAASTDSEGRWVLSELKVAVWGIPLAILISAAAAILQRN